MSSNYPLGVTGGEYQIAGADSEYDEKRHCENCGQDRLGTTEQYKHESWWTCATCEHTFDLPDKED